MEWTSQQESIGGYGRSGEKPPSGTLAGESCCLSVQVGLDGPRTGPHGKQHCIPTVQFILWCLHSGQHLLVISSESCLKLSVCIPFKKIMPLNRLSHSVLASYVPQPPGGLGRRGPGKDTRVAVGKGRDDYYICCLKRLIDRIAKLCSSNPTID